MQVAHFVGVRGSFGLGASGKRQPKVLSGVLFSASQHCATKSVSRPHWILTGFACLAALFAPACLLGKRQPPPVPALKYSQGKIPTETVWQACKDAQQAVLEQDSLLESNTVDAETLQLWRRKGMNLSDVLEIPVNALCKSLKRDEDFAVLVKGPTGKLFAVASRENRHFSVSSQNLEALAQRWEALGKVALTIYIDSDCRVAATKPFPILKRPAPKAEPSQ